MDKRRKVELFEEIRREYRFGSCTIRAVAKELGVHRRMVRQALGNAIPPERKTPVRRKPRLDPVMDFIDGILRADQEAPRKQRYTGQRIWLRIRQERPEAMVSAATVRRYVRQRREELGLAVRETFVPQVYAWGGEAQVDWYEAVAEIGGERQQVYNFAIRSMASGGAFHVAYYHATQQAFLGAHELAFQHFGGVFRLLRYDNVKSAVKKILRGHQPGGDRAAHRLPVALGFLDGVLQSGAREREGRGGRRGGLFPAEPSGAVDAASHGEYTCPMHPEIKQAGPGSCPKCGMALER